MTFGICWQWHNVIFYKKDQYLADVYKLSVILSFLCTPPIPVTFLMQTSLGLFEPQNCSSTLLEQVCEPDVVAGTCLVSLCLVPVKFEQHPVMSAALGGQDGNIWTEGGWQRELALWPNRCCNHKEIHNLWIKYEGREQQWRGMVLTFCLFLGPSQ